MRRFWKEYFEHLYNIDTQEQVAVHMCGFDRVQSGGVPEDWRSGVIVSLYKGKGERTECRNYRGISLLRVGRKIYARILVEKVR